MFTLLINCQIPFDMHTLLYLFISFWLCWVIVSHRFSLVVESRGYSLEAVHGLLTAGASLVAEHRL